MEGIRGKVEKLPTDFDEICMAIGLFRSMVVLQAGPSPLLGGERHCDNCTLSRNVRRRVYMSFMLAGGWYCPFLEEDLKTPLPRRLTLADPAKAVEMAERGGYSMHLEGRQALERAINAGRGGAWLELTEEHSAKLKTR
jgi:hypothetical protein